MTTLMITIIPDGTPVDKMEETEEGHACPLPTQDPEVNERNRGAAVSEYNYIEPEEDGEMLGGETCATCGAFNLCEEILDCIGDESGDVGFCQLLKFCAMSAGTCDRWVEGGPITDECEEDYKDNL